MGIADDLRTAAAEARDEDGQPLSRYALARRAGLGYATVHGALSGRPVSLATAEKIAAGLGMRLELRPIRRR